MRSTASTGSPIFHFRNVDVKEELIYKQYSNDESDYWGWRIVGIFMIIIGLGIIFYFSPSDITGIIIFALGFCVVGNFFIINAIYNHTLPVTYCLKFNSDYISWSTVCSEDRISIDEIDKVEISDQFISMFLSNGKIIEHGYSLEIGGSVSNEEFNEIAELMPPQKA